MAYGVSDIDVAAVLQRGCSVLDGRLHASEPEASWLPQWIECVVVAAKTNTEIRATLLIGWCNCRPMAIVGPIGRGENEASGISAYKPN